MHAERVTYAGMDASMASPRAASIVDDWERTITLGFGETKLSDTRGEALVRGVSRASGWTALAASYVAIAYFALV